MQAACIASGGRRRIRPPAPVAALSDRVARLDSARRPTVAPRNARRARTSNAFDRAGRSVLGSGDCRAWPIRFARRDCCDRQRLEPQSAEERRRSAESRVGPLCIALRCTERKPWLGMGRTGQKQLNTVSRTTARHGEHGACVRSPQSRSRAWRKRRPVVDEGDLYPRLHVTDGPSSAQAASVVPSWLVEPPCGLVFTAEQPRGHPSQQCLHSNLAQRGA